jgi:O-succinylbenzoate synthase
MREFWLWVAIVTLLIFLMFVMGIGLVYLDKRLKKAEAIIVQLESKEKKHAKARIDPSPDGDGVP